MNGILPGGTPQARNSVFIRPGVRKSLVYPRSGRKPGWHGRGRGTKFPHPCVSSQLYGPANRAQLAHGSPSLALVNANCKKRNGKHCEMSLTYWGGLEMNCFKRLDLKKKKSLLLEVPKILFFLMIFFFPLKFLSLFSRSISWPWSIKKLDQATPEFMSP